MGKIRKRRKEKGRHNQEVKGKGWAATSNLEDLEREIYDRQCSLYKESRHLSSSHHLTTPM